MFGAIGAYYFGKNRGRREPYSPSSEEFGDTLLALALVPVMLTLFMPYLVWVAVRQNGRGRLAALWTMAVAILLVVLAGAMAGILGLVVGMFAIGTMAFLRVAIFAAVDKKRDESYK